MLGTAKADTFCAKLTGFLCIAGSIRICTHAQHAELISPFHDTAEFSADGSVHRGNNAVVDVAGRTVDGDIIALMEGLAAQSKALVLLVHIDIAAAGNAAGTHSAGNNRRMGGHTAANGQNALRSLHAGNILRRGLQTNQYDLLAGALPFFGIIRGKHDLAAGSTGRSTKTSADRSGSLKALGIKLRVQQGIKVAGINHKNGFLGGSHSLIHQIAGYFKSSLCGSFAVTGLEHIEFFVFNGELHILHITIMIFKNAANLGELFKSSREFVFHLGDLHRSTHAGNNILALSVYKELAHQLLFAGCGVAGKGNAGTAVITHVSESHHLHINGSAPGIRDIVIAAVHICTGVVPAAEHGLDSLEKLHLGIVREISADLGLIFCLKLICKLMEIIGSKLDIVGDTLFSLHLIDKLLKVLFADLHNNIGEHLDKSSVAVPCPSGVIGLLGNNIDNILVKTEVKNGVHHSRHGCTGAGTNADQQRVFLVAEFFAGDLFQLVNVLHDLRLDLGVDLTPVLIILRAGLGAYGKALRNRQTKAGHLSKVGTFAAQQISHAGITLAEQINVLFAH